MAVTKRVTDDSGTTILFNYHPVTFHRLAIALTFRPNMATVLVTGGAGYIGSHMVHQLKDAGHNVKVFDNLSRGHADAVAPDELIVGDIRDTAALSQAFETVRPDVVMHFAALAYVGESVSAPDLYYDNNVGGTINLLNTMQRHGLRRFVFSSTCATYGEPEQVPIPENHPQRPINAYGRSKLIIESLLPDYARAFGLNSVALRYFNAAGCDAKGRVGERHDPETHIIPLVLEAALAVIDRVADPKPLRVFGNQFATPDGTCVRDYIHVGDLCSAHLLAAERLLAGKTEGFEAFNLGNGQGYTVLQVIQTCSRITGVQIPYEIHPARPGDPARLIGSAERARQVLGWQPQWPSLEAIVETAWAWHRAHHTA